MSNECVGKQLHDVARDVNMAGGGKKTGKLICFTPALTIYIAQVYISVSVLISYHLL